MIWMGLSLYQKACLWFIKLAKGMQSWLHTLKSSQPKCHTFFFSLGVLLLVLIALAWLSGNFFQSSWALIQEKPFSTLDNWTKGEVT